MTTCVCFVWTAGTVLSMDGVASREVFEHAHTLLEHFQMALRVPYTKNKTSKINLRAIVVASFRCTQLI
jgi:hypothetical protein